VRERQRQLAAGGTPVGRLMSDLDRQCFSRRPACRKASPRLERDHPRLITL